MSAAGPGLAEGLLGWMAHNRPRLDELMTQEGSRSVHQEFLLAEGGTLPTRVERVARARDASGRAWLRYLGLAFGATWPGAGDDLGGRIETALAGRAERLEAMQIEEAAGLERLGRGGDPEADRRLLELAAQRRMFAEALGEALADPAPPALGRRVAAWGWEHAERLRVLGAQALAASGIEDAHGGLPPEIEILWERSPGVARSAEAAMMWANMRFLAEALEHELAPAG